MNKAQRQLIEMRHKAQFQRENWHVYPITEEAIHILDITQSTVNANFMYAISRQGSVCWCEPDVEDYTDNGGGLLVKHRQVMWQ